MAEEVFMIFRPDENSAALIRAALASGGRRGYLNANVDFSDARHAHIQILPSREKKDPGKSKTSASASTSAASTVSSSSSSSSKLPIVECHTTLYDLPCVTEVFGSRNGTAYYKISHASQILVDSKTTASLPATPIANRDYDIYEEEDEETAARLSADDITRIMSEMKQETAVVVSEDEEKKKTNKKKKTETKEEEEEEMRKRKPRATRPRKIKKQ